MEARKVMRIRRTIKKYKKKDVPMSLIFEILDCGRWAPTHKIAQSWEFIVIKSEEKIRKIAEAANQEWISKAPVLIVVCSNLDRLKFALGEGKEIFGIMECAAASQNIILAARDLGLGSALVGDFDREKVREIIKAPKEVVPLLLITLGYPAEFPEGKRDPLSSFIHVEEFGNPWPEKINQKYEKKSYTWNILKLLE